MEPGMEREYVVVTRARMRNSNRIIVHTYGLYTKSKAKSVKASAKREAEIAGYELEAHACHVLDPESWKDPESIVPFA